MRDRVVVGDDGSTEAAVAVRWAATEARRRGWLLDVVHAQVGPDAQGRARATAEAGATHARSAAPGVDARAVVVDGPPAAALVECAVGARLVVLGRHGAGRLSRALIGSVSSGVLHHAACAVAVVPDALAPRRLAAPVVVGFDGSAGAYGALEAACDHARLHQVDVQVVTAWSASAEVLSPPYWAVDYPVRSPSEVALEEAEHVAGRARSWASARHDVAVSCEPVEGRAAEVLVRRSRLAGLVVVGTRGRGGLTGLVLGSTSHALVQRAHCPVLVTR